ncbi:tetraspanin-11-like [Mercurialis annua]|uniref:tetraspanin-11-like n=1 Tax=Mercurialis annua TaxID=3986 RepID=UPI00216034D5|nr:tetraspanin-11-like [Mercurialis annua]
MSWLRSCLFLSFNFVALISGCFAIGSYLYFQTNGITDCKNVVQKPLLIIGIILILISLIGLIGSFYKLASLLWLYSLVALLVLIGLTLFSVLAYKLDNPNGSNQNLSGLGFKKHSMGDYTQWLQNMVSNGNHWNGIRNCLINHQVCDRLYKDNLIQNAGDFFLKKLSPIESGCCKPPIYCGYVYKNATIWIPKSGAAIKERDCTIWSNNRKKLCYDCNSCKTAVMEKSRKIWRIFAILDFIDIAILLFMFFLSCCTRNQILSDRNPTLLKSVARDSSIQVVGRHSGISVSISMEVELLKHKRRSKVHKRRSEAMDGNRPLLPPVLYIVVYK